MIITLTTDFGAGSTYVAAMKGVILAINPEATIVDLTHSIPPQDVRQAAIFLADVTSWYPNDTVHVAVVDPGVGTDRRIVYARIDDQHFIAPDNGLLSRLAERSKTYRIIALDNSEHWLPEISKTFHGRDIMAPVAAQISLGLNPETLGTRRTGLVQLEFPAPRVEPGRISGSVLSIDTFGNLITDIRAEVLQTANRGALRVECAHQSISTLSQTYADQVDGSLVALLGSSGALEIAVVRGSAAQKLGAKTGDSVIVTW